MVRGKRNFITPNKLELGFSLMWCLHEESLANHIGERKPRQLQEDLLKEASQIDVDEGFDEIEGEGEGEVIDDTKSEMSVMTTMTMKSKLEEVIEKRGAEVNIVKIP
jgi:hypothetical protein